MMRATAILIALSVTFLGRCFGQDPLAQAIAHQVEADVSALAAHRTLGDWRKAHSGERTYSANDVTAEGSLTDFNDLDRRCATSIGQPVGQVKRAAQFLVPSVEAGKLPPLPSKPDVGLRAGCQLEEIWYDTALSLSVKDLVQVLKSKWGEPNGPPEEFLLRFWGPWWQSKIAWHKDGINLWIVSDPMRQLRAPRYPGGKEYDASLAVYIRNDIPPNAYWTDSWGKLQHLAEERSAPDLAKTAAIDSGLTKSVLARISCAGKTPAESVDVGVDRLGRWLEKARLLAPARRAAALLIADYYITCAQDLDLRAQWAPGSSYTTVVSIRYATVGGQFDGCPLGGYLPYTHNFRAEAANLSPKTVGDLADLHALWERETFGYEKVGTAERLARSFPEWGPEIHNALARAREVRLVELASSASPSSGETPVKYDYSRPAMQRERAAAVRDFGFVVKERPSDPQSVDAWQSAWRLLAGLSPVSISFGPGDCE